MSKKTDKQTVKRRTDKLLKKMSETNIARTTGITTDIAGEGMILPNKSGRIETAVTVKGKITCEENVKILNNGSFYTYGTTTDNAGVFTYNTTQLKLDIYTDAASDVRIGFGSNSVILWQNVIMSGMYGSFTPDTTVPPYATPTIGTTSKPWRYGYFTEISLNGQTLTTKIATIGYTLQASTIGFSPTDATTYYFGNIPITPNALPQLFNINIPRTGTIKKAYASIYVISGLATSETSTMSIRLNDTSDITISSAIKCDATYQTFSNTNLSTAVSAGDQISIKWVTPTWATNPGAVYISATIWIE